MSTAAKRKKRNTRGFTLTETLIVVAVLVIIAAFAAPNLIQNWKKLQITELDGTARQIFLTAQSDLTNQKTSGQLVTLAAKSAVVQSKQVTEGAATTTLYYIESGTAQSDLTRTAALMSTLSGSYVLYLDPASGDVTDVYYAKGVLSQNDVEALRTGGDDAALRAEEGIGYYGGLKAASGKTSQEVTEHQQETLELVNGEDLYVKLAYPELGQALSHPDQVLATVTVTDESDHTVTLTADGDSALGSTPAASVYAGVDTDNNYTLYVLLDSMVSGCSFVTLFPTLTAGEDITVTASLAYNGTTLYQNAVIGTTNSLFAAKYDSAVTKSGVTHAKGVEFGYARQLSNLRYYTQGAAAAVQTADIDFTKDSTHRLKTMLPVSEHLSAAPDAFTPIPLTSSAAQGGITINGQDGRGTLHTLSNFKISGTDSTGLIGSCSVSATIQNLRLKDFTVSGRARVGALIGSVQSSGGAVTVMNCGVYQSASGTGSVTGGESASSGAETPTGGLIGSAEVNNGYGIDIESCFSALGVANDQRQTGGLIGKVRGGTTAAPVNLLNSYASGSAASGTAGAYQSTAGGLIGAAGGTVTVTRCFSSADVYGSASCGGLVGSNTGTLSITGSYACGSVTAGSALTYGPLVYGSGTVTFTSCRYLNQTGNTSAADAYSGTVPSGVTACEYDDLAKTDAGTAISNKTAVCHPYRTALQGTAYPFAMVTDEYYGDWPDRYTPAVHSNLSQNVYVVYYEKYGNGSWGYYTIDKDGSVIGDEQTGMLKDNDYSIVSSGYGLLVKNFNFTAGAAEKWDSNFLGASAVGSQLASNVENGYSLYAFSASLKADIDTTQSWGNPEIALNDTGGTARSIYIARNFVQVSNTSSYRTMQVRTAAQLQNLSVHPGNNDYYYWNIGSYTFLQSHDIAVTASTFFSSLSNKSGAGYTYDGQENKISGLTIPLFNNSYGALKNVRLTDVAISQRSTVAALAVSNQGTVDNCHVLSGSVTAYDDAAGLIVTNNSSSSSSVSSCTADCTVVSDFGNAGGLMVSSQNPVSGCAFTGSVTAYDDAAGLIVTNNSGSSSSVSSCTADCTVVSDSGDAGGLMVSSQNPVSGCAFTGSVTAYDDAAGLIVTNNSSSSSSVSSCTADCTVTSRYHDAVGLVVTNGSSALIANCAATGSVTIQQNKRSVAGLVLSNYGTISLSESTCTVTAAGAGSYASGLINTMYGGTVDSSYYNGTVSATGTNSTAAGFCRSVGQGSVSNCFAVGTVSSAGSAAGFTATADPWNGHVRYCYAATKLSGKTVSGFTTDDLSVNANTTRYTNCYWVKQTGFNQTVSYAYSAGKVAAITFDQLKALKTLATAWKWDTDSLCWTLTTTAEQTHPVSAALSGKAYPYPRILGLDYYGDWPY